MKDFEERSEKVLQYLRSDIRYDPTFLPRPFVVEITGTPDAGKTTAIKELDNAFRKIGFRVLCPQEGAEEIRHISRSTPLYNLSTGLLALQRLINLTAGHMYDLVIMDRGIFDPYVWMMYWLEKGKLNEQEQKFYQQFFLSRFWVDKIDAVYFMTCDPAEAMKRHQRIAITHRLGDTTNPDTIATLRDRYHRAYAELKPTYPQLSLIDTTHLDEEAMVTMVADQTLSILEKKAEPTPAQ